MSVAKHVVMGLVHDYFQLTSPETHHGQLDSDDDVIIEKEDSNDDVTVEKEAAYNLMTTSELGDSNHNTQ